MNGLEFLAQIKCFMLDMDGTVYLGNALLPGAKQFFRLLENQKKDYLFLTNNSSKHAGMYAEKLKKLGLNVPVEKILTSGEATTIFIKREMPNAKIFLVGTPALEEEFTRNGFELVDKNPDIAVLGFDTQITYEKIHILCDFVREGVPYIATHPDFNCPKENGFMPDIGSFIALVHASTSRYPDKVIGKPNPMIVEAAISKTGWKKETIAMIGDRLYTDIALGKAGIHTVLVLSGETKAEDIEGSEYRPDVVINNLAELVRIMQ